MVYVNVPSISIIMYVGSDSKRGDYHLATKVLAHAQHGEDCDYAKSKRLVVQLHPVQ